MSTPVDVLAVLEEAQDWLYRSSESRDDDTRAAAVKQVSAAVAELIETQREMLRMLEAAHRQLGMWTGDNKRIQRATAALATVSP